MLKASKRSFDPLFEALWRSYSVISMSFGRRTQACHLRSRGLVPQAAECSLAHGLSLVGWTSHDRLRTSSPSSVHSPGQKTKRLPSMMTCPLTMETFPETTMCGVVGQHQVTCRATRLGRLRCSLSADMPVNWSVEDLGSGMIPPGVHFALRRPL